MLKNNPIGQLVGTAIDATSNSGNLLNNIGHGEWTNAGKDVSKLTGNAVSAFGEGNISDRSPLGTAKNLITQLAPSVPLSGKQQNIMDQFNKKYSERYKP